MLRLLPVIVLSTLLGLSSAFANPPQTKKPAGRVATIDLNDGTTVRGKVKGLKDGFYLIETLSLGELRVSAQRIKGISYEAPLSDKKKAEASPAVKPAPIETLRPEDVQIPGGGNADMQSMMQQMLSNPEVMKLMEQLSQDPAIQKMVTDPKLQKSIEGGNYLELLQHPSIRQLMDNPTVKEITEEVKTGTKPAEATNPAAAEKK